MTVNAKAPRADRARTRERLLDVLGEMLERQGLDVSLPELARESGVAVATVYRHFDDVGDLRAEFYRRVVERLVSQLDNLAEREHGRELYWQICEAWVATALPWARAASLIRSAEGYLERLRVGDPLTCALQAVLGRVIQELIASGDLPEQDVDYASLVWITLFDERVFVDLESAKGWSALTISRHLAVTVLAALQADEPALRPGT